jgi:CRISPR-associated exonuclease Cas4
MTEYQADELLGLSGIQHFCFCRRQWALIYVENQWQENVLTVEGKLLHEKVDDPFSFETRNGVLLSRSMPVASYRLGFVGVCDAVEFTPSPEGVNLVGRTGKFVATPIEYKRGTAKHDYSDEAQLCAQAICLEEMLSIQIPFGYLYYGELRHRVEVPLSVELRGFVEEMSQEMHAYFKRGYTPKTKPSKACKSCSLSDLCLPSLQSGELSARQYIQKQIDKE